MKAIQKPWGTPLQKHETSVIRVFDIKNEDFYYGASKIKWKILIQSSNYNRFCETFICNISAFRLNFTFHILGNYSAFSVKKIKVISTTECAKEIYL